MSITLFDDFGNAITGAIEDITEAFDEMVQRLVEAYKKITEAETYIEPEEIARLAQQKERETQERRCARLLAAQKEAARARAYGLRMLLEKAHRALKWRKRLHDDGVPDGERQAIRWQAMIYGFGSRIVRRRWASWYSYQTERTSQRGTDARRDIVGNTARNGKRA